MKAHSRGAWALPFMWGLLVGELATALLAVWLQGRVLHTQAGPPLRSCYQEQPVVYAIIREEAR